MDPVRDFVPYSLVAAPIAGCIRVLMVNLTYNLKVAVRLALKRFVVVCDVGKPHCVTLLLDGKALVTRGYHSSAGIGIPSFREARFAKSASAYCSFRASMATWALNSGVYFLRDVFPIFDDKVKSYYLP